MRAVGWQDDSLEDETTTEAAEDSGWKMRGSSPVWRRQRPTTGKWNGFGRTGGRGIWVVV